MHPYTHPISYNMHPIPCTLHAPCTLHPTGSTNSVDTSLSISNLATLMSLCDTSLSSSSLADALTCVDNRYTNGALSSGLATSGGLP